MKNVFISSDGERAGESAGTRWTPGGHALRDEGV
jgi:hypothetical protein